MFCLVTGIHDAAALAATCRRLGLAPPAPAPGGGLAVRLPGLHAAVVCRPLTGLVSYHARDNAFAPFARLMRFVHAYYEVRHALRQGRAARPARRRPIRRPAPAALPA
jgi:hypothetical protein